MIGAFTNAAAQEKQTLTIGSGGCVLTATPRAAKPRCYEWSVTSSCPTSNIVITFNRDVCEGAACERTTRLKPIRDAEVFVCGSKDNSFFAARTAKDMPGGAKR